MYVICSIWRSWQIYHHDCPSSTARIRSEHPIYITSDSVIAKKYFDNYNNLNSLKENCNNSHIACFKVNTDEDFSVDDNTGKNFVPNDSHDINILPNNTSTFYLYSTEILSDYDEYEDNYSRTEYKYFISRRKQDVEEKGLVQKKKKKILTYEHTLTTLNNVK